MRQDAESYFFFVDRVGDTFRWKGENVSAGEVAAALLRSPGVREAIVYGVRVPGHEGRAGMAGLVAGEGFDPDALAAFLAQRLPPYALPVFVRLLPEIAVTGTFKYRKVDLAAEGFDPHRTADPLYVRQGAGYAPLTRELYRQILNGEARL